MPKPTNPAWERMLREKFPEGLPLVPLPEHPRPRVRDHGAVHEAGACWCTAGAGCTGDRPVERDPWAELTRAYTRVADYAHRRGEPVRLTRRQLDIIRLVDEEPSRTWSTDPGLIRSALAVPVELVDDRAHSTPARMRAGETGEAMPPTDPDPAARLMVPAYTGTAPVEVKVRSSALAACASGAVLALMSRYLLSGAEVPDAAAVAVTAGVGGLVTATVTFVAGYLARHTPRWVRVTDADAPPADGPAGTVG